MLKRPFFLHHRTAIVFMPPNYRGGRNQWRGFVSSSNYNDVNGEFSSPHFNFYQSFHPPYSSPYYYNPVHVQVQQHSYNNKPNILRPPPFYNQQQQHFRPPPYQHHHHHQRLVSDYRNWEHAKPPPPTSSAERFTVVSYNILAHYLATNHRNQLYFHIPPHILHWEHRIKSILFELSLWSADVLCLQEVDRFQDFQQPLNIRGYSGIWKMRTGEPIDGCAIFWRSSRFKLLHEEAIEFNKFGLRDNVAQICVFESLSEKSSAGSPASCSEGRNKVVICNIHVLYNPKRGDIKLGQVRLLLEKAYATSKLWDDAPVVLCGDYNSTPKSPLYNFISGQKLDVSELPRDKISGQYSAEIRSKRPFTSSFRIQSSDNATQSPTRIDDTEKSSSSLLTQSSDNATYATQKDEQNVPQLEAKEESEGSSVNCNSIKCTSEVLEKISSGVVTRDNNTDELLQAIEDVSVGEVSTSFLTELHGHDGNDVEDGADVADGDDVVDEELLVENQNSFYVPSGWTPTEIEAATGSSECMTMEHQLKLRSTYTEVEDYSGTRDSNGEPQVTSYHRRFQGTVDYIWRSEGLQTVRVLAPIPKHAMEWTPGFPTKKWGSDHVALVAELAFNKLVNDDKSQVQ